MTADNLMPVTPPRLVLLRNGQLATLTHAASGPAPWHLLGRHNVTGEALLWTKDARFVDADPPVDNPFDAIGLDVGNAPVSFAPFVGVDIIIPGGAS